METTRRKSILLVEDEAVIALAEEAALGRLGYKVATAHSGEAAVEMLKTALDFDLILMDIDLGRGIDGTEAAERILKIRDIPIVFLSSHTEPEIVEKTEKITSYGYVVKDSNPAVLDASIKMAFKLFDANRETRKANEKLRAIIDAFPDLMLIVDHDGNFRGFEIGPHFSSLAKPADSIIGAHLRDVFPPEEAAFHLELYRKCIATGKVQEHTYSLTVNGEERFFDLRLSRFDDTSILAIIRDITEREKSDLELRKLSRAIEQSSSIIVITDSEGGIEYVNPKFEEVTGYSYAEAKGRNPRILKSGSVPAKTYDELWKTISSGGTWRGTFINRKKSGAIYHEAAIISPVKNRDGDISHYIAVKEDLSERKRIEDALVSSRNLLNEMGGIAKIGAWKTDLETLHIQWTDELYSIYEVDSSYVPTLDRVLDFFIPESRRLVEESTRRISESGEPFDIEAEMITAKGTRRWIRMIGRAGYTDGKMTHRVGVTQDITDRKSSEELLQLNERKILALLEEKEILLKEVHHRIKNNMASMMSLLALQAEKIQDPAASAALKDAQHRFRSMGILYDRLYRTDNLRELSIKAYLPTLIREIVAMAPNGSGVKIEGQIEDFSLSVKELSLLGLIVNELLTNALKHAFPRGGEGRLRVNASKLGDTVTLSVEDDGIGMPEEPDAREDPGFGLMLVRALAAQVKGDLRIEGGAGTRVVLEFIPSPSNE